MTDETRTTVTTHEADPGAPEAGHRPVDPTDPQNEATDEAEGTRLTSEDLDSGDSRLESPEPEPPGGAEVDREADVDVAADPGDPVDDDRGPIEAGESGDDIPPVAATVPAAAVDPLRPADARAYATRWVDIQAGFVDDPRAAVEQAGTLLSELMDELTRALAADLDRHGSGDTTSTEELLAAFRRYRAVFDRLVAT